MTEGFDDYSDDLEFELDEQEIANASGERDVTGTLRSGETAFDWDQGEVAYETTEDAEEFGRRFFELSLREFESESEVSRELDEILDEMERQYFLGGVFKKIGSAVGKAASGLAKVGAKGFGSLASAAMKGGLLKPLAQAALSFVPGGSMAMPLLQSLGFGGGGGGAAPAQQGMGGMPSMPDFSGMAQSGLMGLGGQFAQQMPQFAQQMPAFAQQMPWSNLADLFRNSYSQLASQVQGEVTDPVQAVQLAGNAFRSAVQQTQRGGARPRGGGAVTTGKTRVVRLRPGEELVIRVVS